MAHGVARAARHRRALRRRGRLVRGRYAKTRAGDLRADPRQARPSARGALLPRRPRREPQSRARARLADASVRRYRARAERARRARRPPPPHAPHDAAWGTSVTGGRERRVELRLRRPIVLLEGLCALEEEVEIELPREADAAVHLDRLAADEPTRIAGVCL